MASYGGGYNQYGGNPYGQSGESGYDGGNNTQQGGYGSSTPYGGQGGQGGHSGGYGGANPYNEQPQQQQTSSYGQPQNNSQYGQQAPSAQLLSRDHFLERIEDVKGRINELTSNISDIGALHQRMISSPDNTSSARLENLVTQTQILNTGIKDEIKYLEKDAVRSQGNTLKDSQIRNLKQTFQRQLQDYQRQESEYKKRYREAIARQYRIVNPDATEAEVDEAANANWGNEGVFQTALKSNRQGQANSVLGAVRARHNDILQIERTMMELAELFQQLNEQVMYQEPMVQQIEQQAEQVKGDTEAANVHLDKGLASARRARKLKWWCLGVSVLIIAIIALVLGIYFGVVVRNRNNNNNNQNQPAPTNT